MSSSPLSIAFLWHMHQPFYKDPFTGLYRLPWVRLHGVKDYLDMVEILSDYPGIQQTFNLVPSLLEQIIDYTDQGATDTFLQITQKRASDLSDADKAFILENFFLANWDTMVRPYPRYYELLVKRGFRVSRGDLARITKYFSTNELLDLQVLFNFVWIDPLFREHDPFLVHLKTKGRDYTEEEKTLLIEKQISLLRRIIPRYRELSAGGQIELSTSPFYHPILPLLCDTDSAKMAMPDIKLPKRRFSHPEDAGRQIRMALDYFERIFGYRPSGMWPSEGSVSEEVVKAISAEGIRWVATDEDILSRTLMEGLRGPSGNVLNPSLLYSVHEYAGVSMIFRDHRISDLLGFVYSGWDPKSAASDLIQKFLHIRDSLPSHEPHIVPVILDGENAWEYYKNDGQDFFRYLYEGLSKDERLKTTTISEFLNRQKNRNYLKRLHAGSWISSDFHVWIGHEEDNTSWDYLAETRESLEAFQKGNPDKNLEAAWKSLYIAEGSDWNWWYGDDHSTDQAEVFDELYRLNLMRVFREMGRDIPPYLSVPVLKEDRAAAPSMAVRGFIRPKIDGIVTSYFEWSQAAYLDVGKSGGSMHMTESLLSRVYYGFNKDYLFIRVDPKTPFHEFGADSVLSIEIIRPHAYRVDVPLKGGGGAKLLRGMDHGWNEVKEITDVAIADVLECAVLFQDVQAREHDEMNLSLSIRREGGEVERCPWRGYITVTVPTPDFEAMMWY